MENVVHFQPPIIHCAPQSLRPVKLKIAPSETFWGHNCCNSSVNSPKLVRGHLFFQQHSEGEWPHVIVRMLDRATSSIILLGKGWGGLWQAPMPASPWALAALPTTHLPCIKARKTSTWNRWDRWRVGRMEEPGCTWHRRLAAFPVWSSGYEAVSDVAGRLS